VLAFVGLGRLDGTVITQSIFPSLVALAGTALGFYFGSSQSARSSDSGKTRDGGASSDTNRTPPVSNAGPDQTVAVGSTVVLKGSGTSGADGVQLTYTWSLTTILPGSTAALTGANTATPTCVADKPGKYVAQLIVNDGLASAPSTTNVSAA
jgi:PKD domain